MMRPLAELAPEGGHFENIASPALAQDFADLLFFSVRCSSGAHYSASRGRGKRGPSHAWAGAVIF